MASSIVAMIPMRGGSQSIPGKNIKPIAGAPLCRWSLEAACKCESIDAVYVSTDSSQIKKTVDSFGLPIKVIDRPDELATSTASTESVMLDFASRVEFETLITIQATSPLTTAADLDAAIAIYQTGSFDSLVTGVVEKKFVWSLDGRPLNYDPRQRPMRQQWGGTLIENGAFYITSRETLFASRCRLGGRIGTYVMGPETAIEIDERRDWEMCEALLTSRLGATSPKARYQQIKLIICDVDGTLTDAGMYYDKDGESLKKFNTRDAHGLAMLQKLGVKVAIVTRENSMVSAARARKLNLPIYEGVLEKAEILPRVCEDFAVTPYEVAMVGDDVNDLSIMKLCGVSACPSDAAIEIKQIATFVSSRPGGGGAVREFCDLLISNRA